MNYTNVLVGLDFRGFRVFELLLRRFLGWRIGGKLNQGLRVLYRLDRIKLRGGG